MIRRKLQSASSLLRQALVGSSTINYTEGSIARATFLLAVPMILEMAMESVFALVDIFFVAGLGTEAVAAVGLTEAVISLLYAVAIGLSMAVTAMVARRIGESNPEGAARVAGQAIWIGAAVSLLVALTGLYYARRILEMMGADASVVEMGAIYTEIMLAGSFTIVFLFLNNAVFRGAGDASIAMRALVLANGINIILDPVLIYGWGPFPAMGVSGAAVATNIGRGVGVLYQLYYLFMVNGRIRLQLRDLGIRLSVILALLRISVGGVAQFLIATASWVFLMRLVSNFGSETVAGYTIALRVVMFMILPAWGLSNAVATLVGQNLGAGKPRRAEQTVWHIARYNLAYMVAVALLLVTFPTWVMGFFTHQEEVIRNGVDTLRILAYGFASMSLGMVTVQAFNGAGDTMTPTWINGLCYWLVQIPLAYLLATVAGWGALGVYWSIFTAEALMSIVGLALFMGGRWKHQTV